MEIGGAALKIITADYWLRISYRDRQGYYIFMSLKTIP